ncbi:MAG: M56 family metallopeptidase, partial [Planctomycetota bacterium]
MMALENILSQEIVQRLGWTLLHFVWQAAAVALLLAVLLAILRKASANLRYTIACLALGLIVLLPVVTIQLVPVSVFEPPTSVQPAPVVLPPEQVSELHVAEVPVVEPPVHVETVSPAPAMPWRQRAAELLEPALPYVVSGWLIGVLALSIWHLGGWTQLQRLRRKMVKPVDASLRAKLDELAGRLTVRRAVQLTESALVQIPTVVGWLRPVILLPASALTGLSAEQLEAILAHELAHIRRHDYLVNMMQTVIETLGFYHPAVWWVSHKIRTEREHCCDDLAVSISGDRVGYARALASMEEIRSARSELAVAATGGNLFSRIRRLLGKDSTDGSRAGWIPSAITILLIAMIALPITLAVTDQPEDQPGSDIESSLLEGFRSNRDKFKCGVLVWTRTTRRDGFFDDEKLDYAGSFQLWWDGKKVATKYVQDRVVRGPMGGDYRIEKHTGGNVYDGGLLSRRPRFGLYENWFDQIIRWTGINPLDIDIARMKKLKNVSLDFSRVETPEGKQIRLSGKNLKDGASGIRYFDVSRGYNLVRREFYNGQGRLYSQETRKLQQVKGGGWFPVEVDIKSFGAEGKVTLHQRFVLDMERCSFNDPSVIPEGIFKFSTTAEQKQLDEILKKLASGTKDDTSGNDAQIVRDSVESFIAAALDGDDEKAAEYAYPDTAVAAQTKDTREILQGQDIRILGVCIGQWNALTISSVIQADHGRTGSVVFHLKKVIQDKETHWLIDDIDLETIDSIEAQIKRFLERNPQAKTILFKPQRPVITPANPIGEVGLGTALKAKFITRDPKTKRRQSEFGFERLLHKAGDIWEIEKPYMNMYRRNSTCYITADEGQVEVETAAGRTTTQEVTFSSNVVIHIVADGAGGVQESFLYLDNIAFLSDQSLLKTTGPFRFVSKDAQMQGTGLELIWNDQAAR